MIILDSSFFIAMKNRRDALHALAARHWEAVLQDAPVLVHEYAFVEMVTVLATKVGLREAVEAGQELFDAGEVEFVAGSPRMEGAWAVFRGQRGTRHGLADAAMLSLAAERGVARIATFDREFRRAKGLALIPGKA